MQKHKTCSCLYSRFFMKGGETHEVGNNDNVTESHSTQQKENKHEKIFGNSISLRDAGRLDLGAGRNREKGRKTCQRIYLRQLE